MAGLERIEKALNSKEDKLWRTWKLWINPTYSPKMTKVESVEKISESGVYDITVEPYPRFIAEGIVVHNSMATPHASGLITCAAQIYRQVLGRELTVEEIKNIMAQLGHVKTNEDGWGLIDLFKFE